MIFFKHNFWGKAILVAGTVVALSGTAVVGAAKGTWTVSSETVSAHGDWSSYGSPNTKKNNSNIASFNGNSIPNQLGYSVRLINSNASLKSGKTGLYRDQTTYGSNNTETVNYKYYADIRFSLIRTVSVSWGSSFMPKRTKKIIIIAIIFYLLLITAYTFATFKDKAGLLKRGNISVHAFFELQSGLSDNVVLDVVQMFLFPLLGSVLFIYLKNNSMVNIQQRIDYRGFLKRGISTTFLAGAGISLLTNIYEMGLINWFYYPFIYDFNDPFLNGIRPGNFTNNDLTEIILFIIFAALGWGVFAVFIFSVGLFVRKTALYFAMGPVLGLMLILLVTLSNMSSWAWRAFYFSWLPYTLIAPGQYTLIGMAPPIRPGLSFVIAAMIYLAVAALLISIWCKKQRKGA
ncbi:hypothetical protein OZX56_02750 [Lactobacillus sp. ESL0684]|uniref:hypothetical protein n=1 Tax=Lactobacillus sp. ESL0684 TaxID=2983213 RepID=UPI0023FA2A24|nr:hypothetical protein [Lactobacillus sp. ESL0684]WEV44165.1 hypothetical protein OZX56_02750 [Lactobacillus sp. ESL0684]